MASKSYAKWYELSSESFFNVTNISKQGSLRFFYTLNIKRSRSYLIVKWIVDCNNYDHAMHEITEYKDSPGEFVVSNNSYIGIFRNTRSGKKGIGEGVVGTTQIIDEAQISSDQLQWHRHKTFSRSVREAYELICKLTK